VAEAVVDGILDRGEMSVEALECLAPALLRLWRNAGVAAEEELKCTRWSTANAACRRNARLSPRPRWVWRFGGRARTPLRFILTDGNSRIIQIRNICRRSASLYYTRHQTSL